MPDDEAQVENEPILDHRLIDAVKVIIDKGSCAVAKPVRAGFTTSCIHACKEMNERLLILAPTSRILKETVSKASAGNIRIPGNIECPLVQESVKDNPILRQLPLFLPDCDECNASGWCDVRAILREEFTDKVSLTYAKLEALMVSVGLTASKILRKISATDVVLLDESHQLALPNLVHVKISQTVNVPSKYRSLKNVYKDWLKLCNYNDDYNYLLTEMAKKGYSNQNLSFTLTNSKPLNYQRQKKAWEQLWKIAEEKTMENSDILVMRDIITILSATELTIGFISAGSNDGAIYFMTGQSRQYQSLKTFLNVYVPRAKHLYVSGTIFEPHPGYFSELSGKEIESVLFPDIRDATKKMTLIPDHWKLTSINFDEKFPSMIETIRLISEKENQPIYLIAPSRRKAEKVKIKLEETGIKDIFVDYYRSDLSMGVERFERVCISLGMAETPINSCDALARGATNEDRWIDSRKLRKQGVDASTWQAVNRVRDPAGQTESRVYFIGCRQDRVLQVATWGLNRQVILREIKAITGSKGEAIRIPIFDIQVDEQIALPNIYSEGKHKDNPNRRRVSDYVKQVEIFDKSSLGYKNPFISSICINRENDDFFYCNPLNDAEIISTINALKDMFVSRNSCYATQYYNTRNKKWNFGKKLLPLDDDIIKQHILGHETVGAYQISPNDEVKWCCIDIDSHHGESDTQDKAKKTTEVLRHYGIPFLLEASGSPNSYHIWIFLNKTKTYNAYSFIRQVKSESELDCEVWPKQKTLGSLAMQ